MPDPSAPLVILIGLVLLLSGLALWAHVSEGCRQIGTVIDVLVDSKDES